jgi:LmbE family N-acetylglucosaminyl deacetylase
MKVLILAPHADDAELACGGTVARMINEEGAIVVSLIFSYSYYDTENKFNRIKETQESSQCLRIEQVYSMNIKDKSIHRNFQNHRQEILDKIVGLKNIINPDIALIPCAADIHQDHQVIHAEGVRGLKGVKTVLGYDTPWNHMINGNYFVPLQKEDVQRKIDAIACYESIQHKPYANPEFIWAWARFRGLQAGSEYAEVFEMIRGGM